ncbi:MAG: hypothetical protein AABX01_07700, partial [Candidatus Micrarchaeota archaeon]
NQHIKAQITNARRKMPMIVRNVLGVGGGLTIMDAGNSPTLGPLEKSIGMGVGGLAMVLGVFSPSVRSKFRREYQKAQRFKTPENKEKALDILIQSLRESIANRRRLIESAV